MPYNRLTVVGKVHLSESNGLLQGLDGTRTRLINNGWLDICQGKNLPARSKATLDMTQGFRDGFDRYQCLRKNDDIGNEGACRKGGLI